MSDSLEPRAQPGTVTSEALNQMLKTPCDKVFAFSSDGQTYTAPRCLVGTPVRKITETEDYWKSGWLSLETFLAQEKNEEKAKAEAHGQLILDPSNKIAKKMHKIHSDNVSKHRKIREIFGQNSSYHPNQLVSKHHLPAEGLCSKEIMYKLACKISDCQILRDRGELVMDAFDFIRWRVWLQLRSQLNFAAQSGKDYVKPILAQIFEDCETALSRPYRDPLLRAAIIRSAGYQNRLNSYGTVANKGKVIGRSTKAVTGSKGTDSKVVHNKVAVSARVEKVRKRPAQPSTYQGVNGFRAEQIARQASENDASKN
ncbi:hypothetical protein NW752_000702 [Fusarium irregulare]|uniref:Uncharacterized protein n=1 Tax=Fusarium irregulare TaxID=2494466 RepID=A0A9W8UF43_9HYPO|nr:hypothetical protein NW766_001129 [Fusarium irregulare]KAJ4028444.1 hypothetical protein NW752_000702 [Fusarium irregulare]